MTDQRRSSRPDEPDYVGMRREGPIWRIGSLDLARQVLRARHATTQAGFTAEFIPKGVLRHHPILMSDGPLHDEQRSKVARFFAPKVVELRHGADIDEAADRYVEQAAETRTVDMAELALHYSVEVTAKIVGLTASPVPAMSRRLVSFFRQPPFDLTEPMLGRSSRQWMTAAVNGIVPLARFHLADVRPAIRARRSTPSDDIISHLIAEDYTDADILVECVTYGTAGMVTTREFITMAAWHLLTDDELRARYLAAEPSGRISILNEIIRLEPVVGHLYRRAAHAFEVTDGEDVVQVEQGDLLDVSVRHTNADPAAIGDDALTLCPGRHLPRGVDESGLAFGDGAHRCPGQPLAMAETDALLVRLLRRGARMVAEPTVGWDDLIEGYTLRGLRVEIPSDEERPADAPPTAAAFDRGAPHYDLMVALNPGYHAELRRAAAALTSRVGRRPGLAFMDIACGSGASTRALADAAPGDARILGLDASAGMLASARAKQWPPGVRFDQAVAGQLDVDDLGRASYDGILTCYLFRNVSEDQRDRAVREAWDLLRPGGWLVVQEYSVQGNDRARRVWDAVCRAVIIPLAWIIDRDTALYRYLRQSVVDFDSVARFADRLTAAGFTDVASRTAGGWQHQILHTFVARKPEEKP